MNSDTILASARITEWQIQNAIEAAEHARKIAEWKKAAELASR